MRRVTVTLCGLVLLLAGWTAAAQAQVAQTILTLNGSPVFNVTSAVAGFEPAPLTSSGLTYFVKSKHPAGPTKITAQLDANMPAGTTLTLTMVPPFGSTSLGPVTLDVTPRNIITNLDHENGSTYGMTYVFTATVAAGVLSQSRTVTLTMSLYP